jgi:integrase
VPASQADGIRAPVRAGIAPIGFHVLRHTHGSIVAAATRDVRAVQRRLRHASASFTLETYIHLLDDRAGVDAVANALSTGSDVARMTAGEPGRLCCLQRCLALR